MERDPGGVEVGLGFLGTAYTSSPSTGVAFLMEDKFTGETFSNTELPGFTQISI